MSDLANKTGSIEKYLEDTINEYLQSQNDVPECYQFDFNEINKLEFRISAEERQKNVLVVEELLNDVLHDVDRTILYQEEYKKTLKAHPQYALFDLANYLPGFTLDKELIRKLCFRETLLISNLDEPAGKDGKPQGVGGLCLKVELVRGIPPSKPKTTEEDINKNIAERIRQIKKEMTKSETVDDDVKEDTEAAKLKKYEEFLQEQTRAAPHKFVVHLSSEFDVNGKNAGSRIISWVDKDFHTLEERRTEYIFWEDTSSTEKILYYALQENKYFVKYRESFKKTNESRKYYPLCNAKDLVGEGANFILMRYLAITRYKGTFELSTIYINGSMCRNIYECQGPRPGFINGNPVDVCKIYRTIIEECGIMHISVTVLTVYGMIVSQEWEGCPYIIHVNPLFVTHGKPVPYDYIALKKVWETNMELVSKYLDCKTEAEFKMKTYLKDHPEIKDMIADYLQSILLLKPENIIPFTVDYFINFEPYQLPQMPYFDEFGENKDNDDSEMFW